MGEKILVPWYIGYGLAVKGLGDITAAVGDFMAHPKDYKLVLFTGGEDVSPELYGERSYGMCGSNIRRDGFEMRILRMAIRHDIKMTGICRGSQFLNVMAGGRMMHHIDNHAGKDHLMETSKEDEIIIVNSLHHQMIVPAEDGHIVGWSKDKLSNEYFGNYDVLEDYNSQEVEAIILPKLNACGVQYHPEMMDEDSDGYKWYWHMVKDFLELGMDGFVELYTGGKKEDGYNLQRG